MSATFRKILLTALAFVILGCASLYVVIERVLPYSVISPHRITHEEIVTIVHGDPTPELFGLRAEPFNITVDDSIRLNGWFIHADSSHPVGTVVILHGLASCKEAMFPRARTLAQAGFNCILYDSRAHGESGGSYCTFGYYEKRDLSSYIDSALVRFGPAVEPVAVLGSSLGAAVALQAMEADRRISCGVVESPFAALREVVFDYMRQRSVLSARRISDMVLDRAAEIAQFQVDSVRPEESARHIDQPVMVVHGLLDARISPEYGKRVYQNLRSVHKEWVPMAQADHFTIASVGGERYKQQTIGFFRRYMREYDEHPVSD
jgi:pimeloyl-ACP methyl ester carboxylesterase